MSRYLHLALSVIIIIVCNYNAVAQANTDEGLNGRSENPISLDSLNGMPVFRITDIAKKFAVNENSINEKLRHDTYVYSVSFNKTKTQYLRIWAGPDIGLGIYYQVGLTKNLVNDKAPISSGYAPTLFTSNNNIKLGDSLSTIWQIAELFKYRKFEHQNKEYYYVDIGYFQKVPYIPQLTYYFVFKNDILIEFGFGKGMFGVNPMFM